MDLTGRTSSPTSASAPVLGRRALLAMTGLEVVLPTRSTALPARVHRKRHRHHHRRVARTSVSSLVVASATADSLTARWVPPAAGKHTGYRVSRSGARAQDAFLTWSGELSPAAESVEFLHLSPDTEYTMTVTALPDGSPVVLTARTAPAAGATAAAGADPLVLAAGTPDWTAHFASRREFERDWWPCFSWSLGGVKDPSGDSWTAGSDNDFYPFAFHTDPEAPGGQFVRVMCDRVDEHPADVGRTGGLAWLGSEATSRRGWSSGYIEFCARFPAAGTGTGGWPALWLYAQQSHRTSGVDNAGAFAPVDATARAAEIDLLEVFGLDTPRWTTTVHAGSPGSASATTTPLHTGMADEAWHVWGCHWEPAQGVIDFYVDHVKYASAAPADAARFVGQELCARMNYTVGGPTSPWMPRPSEVTPGSLYMDVSYVRHYAEPPF